MKTNLIPEIKEIKTTGGSISIADYVLTDEFVKAVPASVELLEETGAGKGTRYISLLLDGKCAEEEYTVSITTKNITVGASTSKGAYYGLCTIAQLSLLNNGRLECCEIHDWPGLKVRGLSDDISRGQISTLENFKSIVKRLSRYKCNLYMPYIEDTFAYKCLPESGKYSDPVGAEEWKELVEYAKQYYVDIIPIVNIFGHWDKNSVLEAFEGYMLREGDKPDGRPMSVLDVRKPEVREMACRILDEVTSVFGNAGYIHVGGDEVGGLTHTFSKAQAAEIYNGYYKFINEELKKRGCNMLMYSDMYTPIWGDYQLRMDDIDDMPDDISFVYWDYAARKDYKNIKELIRHGKRFYISPATYSWNRFLPHIYLPWLNTKKLAGLAPEHYEGLIMSTWCDGGMNLREENWFGILIGSLFAWEPKSVMTQDEFITLFYEVYYGIEGINLDKVHSLFDHHKFYIPGSYDETSTERPMEFWYDDVQGVGPKLYNEFWKDSRLPVNEDLKAPLKEMMEEILKAQAYFEGLKPVRNNLTHETLLFDIKRFVVNIKKLNLLKSRAYSTRDEAMADIPKILALADEVAQLRNENKRLWFAANRESEWEFCECRYMDLENSLRSLARYCKVAKNLRDEKFL